MPSNTAWVNPTKPRLRLLIGTPTLGIIRIEWHNAVNGMVVPCNWGMSTSTPTGYLTHDGQNIIVHQALEQGFDWVLFLEDDTVPPVDLLLKVAPYVQDETVPIVSGLYHVKGGNEPMVYRGRGNGAFRGWKPGDKVWCDGVPTGCLLIHRKILIEAAKGKEAYTLVNAGISHQIPKLFDSPRLAMVDPKSGGYQKLIGTSDLHFCDYLLNNRDIFVRAGWPKLAKRQYPFLVDTALRCGHIDRDTGRMW
jgi:hypothetical protein